MKISVFGLGYVGSVTAVCLAELGHEVYGVDVVPQKVDGLNRGIAPVREPRLEDLLRAKLKTGRLRFYTQAEQVIAPTDCAIISVGTPTNEQQQVDLSAVTRCVETISQLAVQSGKAEYLIVIHSTVPPGTTRRMQTLADEIVRQHAAGADTVCRISVCMNPEFLREGSAVQDFFHPALTVIGLDDLDIKSRVKSIFAGIEAPEVWVATQTAELLKYVNNAFHAVKVAFANEVDRIADAFDVDGSQVMQLLCEDKKLNISAKYLRPGFAFGGSCLPKDLRGINSFAEEHDIHTPLLHSVLKSNDAHIEKCKEQVLSHTGGRVGVLGVAFKAGTDDVRESPALRLIRKLTDQGVEVRMSDVNLTPEGMMGANRKYIDRLLPDWHDRFSRQPEDLFTFADTIVLTTNEAIYHDWVSRYATDQTILYLYNQRETPSAVISNL